VLIGNPRPASRTHEVALRAAQVLAPNATPDVIDLTALAPVLLASHASVAVEDAVERIAWAGLLVVASPTYKGTYTGLLKAFLDRVPSLAGVTALPLLVMGSHRHALAVEVHLRPLLLELGATCPTPGLFVEDSRLEDPAAAIAPWLEIAAPALRAALDARVPA
jgi:FMN reductase